MTRTVRMTLMSVGFGLGLLVGAFGLIATAMVADAAVDTSCELCR